MSTPPTGSPNTEVKAVSQEMTVLSNILAAYTFIADQPERTALVFVGGVCVGLLVTLCAIVFQIHCRADCHYGNSKHPHHRHGKRHNHHGPRCPHHQPRGSDPSSNTAAAATAAARRPAGDTESEDWEDTADLSARQRRRFERALLPSVPTAVFTSAEELDRAQRLEDRERILREIWMNGQPDISTITQSLNRYY
ncbi:protein eva-1 homolog A [Genypterus blacodes]|uniref:protein eva-1 homolog A n=1 Tax=Genypterus blacodes TaxID=154954 RepID=UPI003F75A817